jgi:hypothetical protein
MRNNPVDWPFPSAPSTFTMAKFAGVAVGAYMLYKFVLSKGVFGASAAITRGAADAAAGVVVGAGEAIGIPQTDQERCAEAIYAGRTWDASFMCPAADFLRYVVGGVKPPRPGDDGLSGPRLVKTRARRMIARYNRNC